MKKKKGNILAPLIALGLCAALMLVSLTGIIITGAKRVTVTGTITSIKEYNSYDTDYGGMEYMATVSAQYKGRTYTVTKQVSKSKRVGDSIRVRIHENSEDERSYDQWFAFLIADFILSVFPGVWLIIAYSRRLKWRRARTGDIRGAAQAALLSPQRAQGDSEAVRLVNERCLPTGAAASALSEDDWKQAEVRAAILRPDIGDIEERARALLRQRVDQYIAGVGEKDPRFKPGEPKVTFKDWTVEWTEYTVGEQADECELTLICRGSARYMTTLGKFKPWEITDDVRCAYKYRLTLSVDLKAAVEFPEPYSVSESISSPD